MLKTGDMWLRPGDLQSVVHYVDHSRGQHDGTQTAGHLVEATHHLLLTLELSITTLFLSGTLYKTCAQNMAYLIQSSFPSRQRLQVQCEGPGGACTQGET